MCAEILNLRLLFSSFGYWSVRRPSRGLSRLCISPGQDWFAFLYSNAWHNTVTWRLMENCSVAYIHCRSLSLFILMILDSSLLNWVEREFGFSFCSHESQYSCVPLSHWYARRSLLTSSAGAAFSFNSFLMPATWGSITFHRLRLFHKIVSTPHFRCQFQIPHCLLCLCLRGCQLEFLWAFCWLQFVCQLD